jgi:hypothetical protein
LKVDYIYIKGCFIIGFSTKVTIRIIGGTTNSPAWLQFSGAPPLPPNINHSTGFKKNTYLGGWNYVGSFLLRQLFTAIRL